MISRSQSQGAGRSLILDESDKPRKRKISGIRLLTTTVNVASPEMDSNRQDEKSPVGHWPGTES